MGGSRRDKNFAHGFCLRWLPRMCTRSCIDPLIVFPKHSACCSGNNRTPNRGYPQSAMAVAELTGNGSVATLVRQDSSVCGCGYAAGKQSPDTRGTSGRGRRADWESARPPLFRPKLTRQGSYWEMPCWTVMVGKSFLYSTIVIRP